MPDEGDVVATSEPTDGVAHLQKAALEMIAAARAFLEVAEKVVENPETVRNAVVTVRHAREDGGAVRREPEAIDER